MFNDGVVLLLEARTETIAILDIEQSNEMLVRIKNF